jgi:hypothetical protein
MTDIKTYKLPDLNKSLVIVYPTGRVTPAFQRFWQGVSIKAQEGSLAHSELPNIVADVSTNAQAITTTQGSIASLSTTVTANYNGQQSQISTLQSAVGGLNGVYGKYGVNIAAGGQFSGFELMAGSGAGGTVSSFRIGTTQFVIDSPAGSTQPFVYDAFRGWLTVQNVRVRGDLIVDGTVFTNAIAPLAVTNNKIERDSITYGVSVIAVPGVVLNGAGMTTIFSYGHPLIGSRARMFWQLQVVNLDPTLPADMELEVRVNGAVQRVYTANIRAGYSEHHSFSVNAFGSAGGFVTLDILGRTNTGAGGAANLTAYELWLDIDDFGTEA